MTFAIISPIVDPGDAPVGGGNGEIWFFSYKIVKIFPFHSVMI